MDKVSEEFAALRLEFETFARGWSLRKDEIAAVFSFLEPLREYHQPTAVHSLRVGVLAGRISERGGRPAYLGAIGGALHDVGKIGCPIALLNAHTMPPEDYELIKPHVEIGYLMLRERFPEPAESMKHHHDHNGYPDHTRLPPPNIAYSQRRQELHKRVGKDIAIADFVDTMKTRNTDKFGDVPLTAEQKYDRLREAHAAVIADLDALINDGIIRF